MNALLDAAQGVEIRTRARVIGAAWDPSSGYFDCDVMSIEQREQGHRGSGSNKRRQRLRARKFVMASGSVQTTLEQTASQGFGLSLVPPVPSLFSFTSTDSRLQGLEGVSVPAATVSIAGLHPQTGPLLLTHRGISGPAVLRLSAFGARKLAETKWKSSLRIDWTASRHSAEAVFSMLEASKAKHGKRRVRSLAPRGLELPKRLWARLCSGAVPQESLPWAQLTKTAMRQLAADVTSFPFAISGRSTNKEEFVTAGGVALENLRMPSMESRRFPGLYSIGEMNDIDGVTGGFNFTSCWSQAWHAGNHIAAALGNPAAPR